jgi:membrane-bound lytic murein transglycosylase B
VLRSATKSSSALVLSGKVVIVRKIRCERPSSHKLRHSAEAQAKTKRSKGKATTATGSSRACTTVTTTHKQAAKQKQAGNQAPKLLSGSAAVNSSDSDGGTPLTNPPAPAPAPVASTPTPWGGSEWANPFNAAELQFYASLVKNINLPPKYLIPIYKAAARRYRLPWQLLAAINRMETDYGADLGVSSAGAVGWMQFEPATWEEYGMAINRHNKRVRGTGNPYNPRDAIFSAARYLHVSGASRSVPRAVFAYNHATWYVIDVLSIAQQVNVHGLHRKSKPAHKIGVMVTTARLLNGLPYVWGGGHSNWTISIGYDCSGFVSMVLHSGGFLKSPQTTQTLPYQPWMRPGKGRWVTIYDRTDGGSLLGDHVIIKLKGQWWESGGSSLSGGAERVHRIKATKAFKRDYLPTFNVVMHPYGL